MRTAYFHVGISKTGSSALQSYLSHNYVFSNPDTRQRFVYCCMRSSGRLLTGRRMKDVATKCLSGYLSSGPSVAATADLVLAKAELDSLFNAGFTPIFSQEAWCDQAAAFNASEFFGRLGVQARIVIYVRPQLDWFNSAWWQWFAWDANYSQPQDLLNGSDYNLIKWTERILPWCEMDNVESVTVRLHPGDIITDFFGLLGMAPPTPEEPATRNQGLPPTLLKLLLKYPQVRSPHLSWVDHVLRKQTDFTGPSPWVINQALATDIIEGTRSDNERLATLLDDESRRIMLADRRWWSADEYAHKQLSDLQDLVLDHNEMEALLGQLLEALLQQFRPVAAQEAPKPQ